MAERAEVLAKVQEILVERLDVDPGDVNEGAHLRDDLEADSLALIELVEALEQDLGERTVGFAVDDDGLVDLLTVGDAVDYVVARLGGAAA